MYEELYLKKNSYEQYIKNLNDIQIKLEKLYSNLILCKEKIQKDTLIEENYFEESKLEKIIKNIYNTKEEIKNVIIPEAKINYNEIIYELSKL